MIHLLIIAVGLAMLFMGGTAMVKGVVSLANRFNMSTSFLSAVLIGFGTSMPELVISIGAVFKNVPTIALGNAIGSNIANVLFVIGLAASLKPISITRTSIQLDTLTMMLASVLLIPFIFIGSIHLISGVILILILLAYLYCRWRQDKANQPLTKPSPYQHTPPQHHSYTSMTMLTTLVGIVSLIAGAYLVIDGATGLAKSLGVSNSIIALSIIALGTSLPEVVTALIALQHQQSDIIIGNILGSNIFNILGILGVTAIFSNIPVNVTTAILINLGVTTVFGVGLLRLNSIKHYHGLIMLIAYCCYIYWLYAL